MIPCRKDYCEKLELGENIYFLPNKFLFRSKNFGKKGWCTYLDIIGIVPSGQKTLVRTGPIRIFVDIEKTAETVELTKNYVAETVVMLPGKYFSEPREYLRVLFPTIRKRKNFIEANYGKWTMGNDDDKYEYVFFRESKSSTATWNIVTEYSIISEENSDKLPVQILLRKMRQAADEEVTQFRDKSVICAWDLETYTPNVLGGVPMPGNRADSIKMCAMVFRPACGGPNYCSVLITAVPVRTDKDIVVLYTDNIPQKFAEVLGSMQPDYLTGYNDGGYDWPFMKERIRNLPLFVELVGTLKLLEHEAHFCAPMRRDGYCRVKQIKIEAGGIDVTYDAFQLDGCITFDTMYIMRKLNKKETKRSLNVFLKKYGIELKEDMPYSTMAKIFHLWELTTPEEMKNRDPASIPFPYDGRAGTIAINRLTATEIIHLFDMTASVGTYCVRDSAACLDLLERVRAIPDFRDFMMKACCQMQDAFYKADGIKVRNCILKCAREPKWGSWEKKYPLSFQIWKPHMETRREVKPEEKKKFPGGYVRNPEIGIYAAVDRVDRPCSGLDAASLYPSIIMAYNISPEYLSMEPVEGFQKISTHFKCSKDPKSKETRIKGWFLKQREERLENGTLVRHNFGIIPTILDGFFVERKGIKASMHKWEIMVEKLSKDAKGLQTLEEILNALRTKIKIIEETASGFTGMKQKLELNKRLSFEKAIKFIEEQWRGSAAELLERSSFWFNYYNGKQLTVKVFMNTFYGEMGNENSPFFIPIMGGAVTKMGRTAIKDVGKMVETHGYRIYYGDTDSIYISAPEECFADVDRKYEEGLLTREAYFEEMVGITMSKMQEVSKLSNDYFLRTRGNGFLTMAYEEVLFPFGFFGKKNYFGVQHMHSIDFTICRTEDRRLFERELFTRGMPLRRRDASGFVKKILVEILFNFCRLDQKKDCAQIVDDVLKFFIEDVQRNPEPYIPLVQKNYSIKVPKVSTTTTQIKFRNKMLRLHTMEEINRAVHMIRSGQAETGQKLLDKHVDSEGRLICRIIMPDWKLDMESYVVNENLLKLKFEVPNFGDRYDLVAARYPPLLKENGSKATTPKGEIMEFIGMIGNKDYARYLCDLYLERGVKITNLETIEVDFGLYFENFFKMLSRYIMFLPQYKEALRKKIEEQGGPLKEAIKEAEKLQMREILKETKNKYMFAKNKVEMDVVEMRERFQSIRQNYDEVAGRGKIAREIMNVFMDPSKNMRHVRRELEKDLEKPRAIRCCADFGKLGMLGDRSAKIIQIEGELESLMRAIEGIMSDIESGAYYIGSLERDYERIMKKKMLEAAISMARRQHMEKVGLFSIDRDIIGWF
jgi:DNA polymerase elongation subunit (family B)